MIKRKLLNKIHQIQENNSQKLNKILKDTPIENNSKNPKNNNNNNIDNTDKNENVISISSENEKYSTGVTDFFDRRNTKKRKIQNKNFKSKIRNYLIL